MKNKNKIILAFLAIFLLVGWWGWNNVERGFVVVDDIETDQMVNATIYFRDLLVGGVTNKVGYLPEGSIDAYYLLETFSGLQSSDFNSVEGIDGQYQVVNQELKFINNGGGAGMVESQITDAGYQTLLSNLAQRLGVEIFNQVGVATVNIFSLVEKIDTKRSWSAKIGQTTAGFSAVVTPLEVLEDSRCPQNVNCIQAGTVRLRAKLSSDLVSESEDLEEIFTLNKPIQIEGERIDNEADTVTLVKVEPSPKAGVSITPTDYIFYFEEERK